MSSLKSLFLKTKSNNSTNIIVIKPTNKVGEESVKPASVCVEQHFIPYKYTLWYQGIRVCNLYMHNMLQCEQTCGSDLYQGVPNILANMVVTF